MNDEQKDPDIQRLFVEHPPTMVEGPFVDEVQLHTKKFTALRVTISVAAAFAFALIAWPFKEFGLMLSQLLLTNLVHLEAGLVRDLFAPINTLGGLLSLIFLTVRLFYRRLSP